jgi:hypothetical protein
MRNAEGIVPRTSLRRVFYCADEIIDAKDTVVVPGFIDTPPQRTDLRGTNETSQKLVGLCHFGT